MRQARSRPLNPLYMADKELGGVMLPTMVSLICRPTIQMREDGLPRKEVIMTTQEIVAFVLRGYDAYNAHQSDPHWLDYANEDVSELGT
jgi:hypothetical protein